jgi:hypothetical protein
MAFRPLTARAPAVLLREAKPLKAIFSHANAWAICNACSKASCNRPPATLSCGVWREGSLLLIVTDGHWATRLRYQQKRLQRQLQMFDEFASLTRILFKVQPPTVPARCRRAYHGFVNDAAATIQATADGISDPNPAGQLERLAHARPKG